MHTTRSSALSNTVHLPSQRAPLGACLKRLALGCLPQPLWMGTAICSALLIVHARAHALVRVRVCAFAPIRVCPSAHAQEADLIVAIGSRFDDRTTGVLNK
eukprot:6195720-Pleurochrysis_carterae.AAC.1